MENFKELIPIQENNGKRAVSARLLHSFLESKQQFADWIKNRIEQCDLIENQDFEVFQNFMKNHNGGRPLTEYALTIDSAKEISMIEGNDKGKQARRYFIACEKKMKELSLSSYQISDPIKRAEKWIEEERIRQQLALDNETMKPKAEFFDAVADSKDAISIGSLAKVLGIKGMGRNNLFEFLRQNKVLMNDNTPYQRYVDSGMFRVVEQKYMKDGEPCINIKTLVYQKGVDYVRNLIKNKHAA